jgi:hypothetical protein
MYKKFEARICFAQQKREHAHIQSNKTQKHVGLRSESYPRRVSTSVHCIYSPSRMALNVQITSVKTETAELNPQQQHYRPFSVLIAWLNWLQHTPNNPLLQITFVRTENE